MGKVKVLREYETEKGTRLPLIDMRGKEYLQVKHRLVWFREVHPTWPIVTTPHLLTETSAFFVAHIKDEAGRILSTGHKYEDKNDFFDFREKAETGAIGRALAHLGFGTQFCGDELDEGERIVDSPGDRSNGSPKTDTGLSAGESKNTNRHGLSRKQMVRLFAIGRSNKWDNSQIKDYLQRFFELSSTDDMQYWQYQAACEFLQSNTPDVLQSPKFVENEMEMEGDE